MERKKGFSLIELLVVMLIIAILATIGISTFMSSQKKGRDSKRKTDLAQMQRALESYINDYNIYPHSDATGKIIGCGNNDTACLWGEAFFNSANDTVYLAQLPKDAASGQQYYYEFVEPNGYRIYSRLENTSDPVIPETGQYSTICGEETNKYCNYVVTSENVSSPVAYSIPTCKATGASCTASGECCDNANCCDGKCQSAACLKPDGETCSLGTECVGGNCCNGTCQSTGCCKAIGAACTASGECCDNANCCDGKCQSAACCTPGVDCRCWSSNGTTCDPLCNVTATTKSGSSYPTSCSCTGGSCGCHCVGDCWEYQIYPSCRGRMCWGSCTGDRTCTVANNSFIYTGSGACSSSGTGACYKLLNLQTYYSQTANCCGTSSNCSCGSAATGYTSYQSCTYIN